MLSPGWWSFRDYMQSIAMARNNYRTSLKLFIQLAQPTSPGDPALGERFIACCGCRTSPAPGPCVCCESRRAVVATLAGLTANDPQCQAELPADADTSVDAVVSVYGLYDWHDRSTPERDRFMEFLERVVVKRSQARHPEVFRAASPTERVHSFAPPFLAVHGSNDGSSPSGRRARSSTECSPFPSPPRATSNCQAWDTVSTWSTLAHSTGGGGDRPVP
jgi:hypothetical protein